jgi:two-component system response regulator HydG
MKTKLLLVDDDSSVVAALTVALGGEGFDVLHAFNGHQAVAIYRRIRVDIVLLDLNMPVKNGWDTFERLNSINPLLPIIIITGLPDQSALAEAAGVAALVEKPLEIPALLETIRATLAEPAEARLARIAGPGSR